MYSPYSFYVASSLDPNILNKHSLVVVYFLRFCTIFLAKGRKRELCQFFGADQTLCLKLGQFKAQTGLVQ